MHTGPILYLADETIEIDHKKRTLFVASCRSGKTTRIAESIDVLKKEGQNYIYILTKYHTPPSTVTSGSIMREIGNSIVYIAINHIAPDVIEIMNSLDVVNIENIIALAIKQDAVIFIDESDLLKDVFDTVIKYNYNSCVVALQGLKSDFAFKMGRELTPEDFQIVYMGRLNCQEDTSPINRNNSLQPYSFFKTNVEYDMSQNTQKQEG